MSSEMLRDEEIRVKIVRIVNGTFHARIYQVNDTSASSDANEDYTGALVYVCVVIFIYGFSIIFMIASLSLKDRHEDRGLNNYIKDFEKLRVQRRQKTYKTIINDKILSQRGLHSIQEAEDSLQTEEDSSHVTPATQQTHDCANLEFDSVTSQQALPTTTSEAVTVNMPQHSEFAPAHTDVTVSIV